jgi:CYTH domain-containing protein
MDIDLEVAKRLGFPRARYTSVERERRWLCREAPVDRIARTETINDLYVTGARLRLREARPTNGGEPMLRLTRKNDVDAHTRLITSIYLPEEEFAVLAKSLTGLRVQKLRHRLKPIDGVYLIVDEFQGALSGLFLAEAEFETHEALSAYAGPSFAVREVTEDPRYKGVSLAAHGIPGQ